MLELFELVERLGRLERLIFKGFLFELVKAGSTFLKLILRSGNTGLLEKEETARGETKEGVSLFFIMFLSR